MQATDNTWKAMRTGPSGEKLIYISYGMWKSGSTLAFELTRAILEQNGYPQTRLSQSGISIDERINFVPELYTPELEAIEQEARARGYPIVLKTHARPTDDVKIWAAQGRIIGHCVYRDAREMALSLMDHGARSRAEGKKSFAHVKNLDSAILSIHKQVPCFQEWVRLPGMMPLYYDDVAFDTAATVRLLCRQLGLKADPRQVARIAKTEQFTQYNKGVRRRFREMAPEDGERVLQEFRSFHEEFIEPRSHHPLRRLWGQLRQA